MESNKMVLTYKRKRFSSKSHLAHGTNADNLSPKSPSGISSRRSSTKIDFDTYEEELKKDCVHCFRCGDFDVNENLLGCECCSETYHLQCIDPPQKYIPQGKWCCLTCSRRQDFEESLQHHVRESKRTRKNKRVQESDMGPMKLRSQKVLLSIKRAEDSTRKANSSAADSSVNKTADSIQMGYSYRKSDSAWKITCVEGSARSNLTDQDYIRKPSPVRVTSSTERKCSSGCPKDIVMVTLDSDKPDNGLSNYAYLKENCSTPLITFCRRVKKKQDVNETFAERNSNAKEKQCSSATLSSYAVEANYLYEASSQNCSSNEQSTSAAVLLQQAERTTVENEAGLETTPPGGFVEAKIAGDECEDPHIGNHHLVPSQTAANVPEELSDQFMAASAIDVTKDSNLIQVSIQSNSANIETPVREESEKKLAILDSEKRTLPHDTSEKRDHPRNLELSVALPASTCLSNIESSKPSMDIVSENLLESQKLPTPSCPIVLVDEETDGRGKELEWLENLDKVLQEKKKHRDTCSFIELGGINCGQTSSGRASPVIPTKSSGQSPCDQDASNEYMNQIAPLQGRTSLAGNPGCEQQQHEETPNKSSLCTNFLGLSLPLPLNPEAHVDYVKDFQSTLSSSTSGVKENARMHNRQLLWHALDEPLLRHKQIVGNVIAGTRMLKERQGSFLDKFKMYSNEWSEEELDFLWIGVRRHGINNWRNMLKDQKLRFLESRVAEDLAMRWDLEQKKLMNSTLFQPVKLSRPDHSYSPFMDDALIPKPTAWSHASSEFPILTAETKLSLGDVYHQKEYVPKRNLFHASGVGTANPLKSESSSTGSFLSSFSIGSVYPKAGFRYHNPIRVQNRRYDWELSTLQQKSSERTTIEHQSAGLPSSSNNLPHWLKEVLNEGPNPSELPPAVSTTALSVSLLNNDLRVSALFPCHGEPPAAPKDPRGRGILKRKSKSCGSNTGGLSINEMFSSPNEPWMGPQAGVLPVPTSQKPTLDIAASEQNHASNLNKKSSEPIGPGDLVVIDSDASSEETISDDQSSRPLLDL